MQLLKTVCFFILLLLTGPCAVTAQTYNIGGLVTDQYEKEAALEGVCVFSPQSKDTVFTDQFGRFEIEVTAPNGVLYFQAAGYQKWSHIYDADRANKNYGHSMVVEPQVLRPLRIGDAIPDHIWDFPLQVMNHPTGRSKVSLREYKNLPLICIDTWSFGCSPCIRAIDEIEQGLYKEFADRMGFITIHVGNIELGLNVIKRKDWKAPVICGASGASLMRAFFQKNVLGSTVFIRNGVLIAVCDGGGASKANIPVIKKILTTGRGTLMSTVFDGYGYTGNQKAYEQRLEEVRNIRADYAW